MDAKWEMNYRTWMLSIGWVMFWKAIVLSVWATFQELRDARKARGVDPRLVVAFQEEWQRRRAKQPLALTYRPAEGLGGVGPVGEDLG